MATAIGYRRILEYHSPSHRVWILGQRCHHGATGSFVAALGCLGLLRERQRQRARLALALTGGALMAHDWKDHTMWFERGYGTQP